MRVQLREASAIERKGGRLVSIQGSDLVQVEIDTKKFHFLGPDIIYWRDMAFTFDGIEDGVAVYSRATSAIVNWYPNEHGELFTG